MAGFNELLTGDNGRPLPVIGFSAHPSGVNYGAYQPTTGFAAGLAQKEPTKTASPYNAEKAARRKQRAQNREPSGLWPAIHIARHIRLNNVWDEYALALATGTEGTGKVRHPKTLSVEYFSHAELAKMLDKKFPEIVRDHKEKAEERAKQTANSILGSVGMFVDQQFKDLVAADHLQHGEDRVVRLEKRLPDCEPLAAEAHALKAPAFESLWGPAEFEVIDMPKVIGNRALAYMFGREARRTMREERNQIAAHLGAQAGWGMNIRRLNPDWEPRVTVFETHELPLSEVNGLEIPDVPFTMSLRPPQASPLKELYLV